MAKKRIPRPRDPIALAKLIGDIATGQTSDEIPEIATASATVMGRKGAAARANRLTPEQRAEIARIAAAARWKKD